MASHLWRRDAIIAAMSTRETSPHRTLLTGCGLPLLGIGALVLLWSRTADGSGSVLDIVLWLAAIALLLLTPILLSWVLARLWPSPSEATEDELAQARQRLATSRQLLAEWEAEQAARSALLERRHTEADRYQRLASLTIEQAELVEELITRNSARQVRTTWVQWYASMVLAFVLGLIVNWVSDPIRTWLVQLLR